MSRALRLALLLPVTFAVVATWPPASTLPTGLASAPPLQTRSGPTCGRWTAITSRRIKDSSLSSIAGLSPTNVWAVGTGGPDGLVLHWNGSIWRQVRPAKVKIRNSFVQFDGITIVSKSDMWAVGTADVPVIEHWNGHRWALVPSPANPNFELAAIAADSPTDAWSVGVNPGTGPVIEHWNGSRWRVVPNPDGHVNGEFLNAVTAFSPKDAWALGSVAEHWNGAKWIIVRSPDSSPSIATASAELWSVAAISASDIWTVDAWGAVFHWDGRHWLYVPDGLLRHANHYQFRTVSASSDDNVWIGGFGNQTIGGRAVAQHWNGRRWAWSWGLSDGKAAGWSSVDAMTTIGRQTWAVGESDIHGRLLIERYNRCA